MGSSHNNIAVGSAGYSPEIRQHRNDFWRIYYKFIANDINNPVLIEKELLVRIMNADHQAFREFFELYVRKIYQFVLGYIKNKAEAEDITQNIFIKIWESRGSIDISKSFEGFIFTIAHRMVLDHFRRREIKLKLHENFNPGFVDEIIASSMSPEDLLNRHQLESLYERSLRKLPPKRKEIFLLSRHKGLSNKEIAERLGISVKTVENQMTAALSSLRAFFLNSDLNSLIILYMLVSF